MKIDRFTFMADTKMVSVNGERYQIEIENVEPKDLRAIQWYGNADEPWGEFEFEGKLNEQFFDFALIEAIYAMWVKAKDKAAKEAAELQKEIDLYNGRYDVLRANEYPMLDTQVGALMKVVEALIENKVIASTPEIDELLESISSVKAKYPKPGAEETATKTKKKKAKTEEPDSNGQ